MRLVAVGVGLGLVVACSSDAAVEKPRRTTSTARPTTTVFTRPGYHALFGVQVAEVDGQLWVFGGDVGPDGASPPVSNPDVAGWGPNRDLRVYDHDGALVRTAALLQPGDYLNDGTVFDDAGTHYILGTLCHSGLACSTVLGPALIRVGSGGGELVPLQLPHIDLGTDISAGSVSFVGTTPGTVWLMQELGRPDGQPVSPDDNRLLAIDVASGVGTEVPLPTGLYGDEVVCIDGRRLFAGLPVLEGNKDLTGVQLVTRPADTTAAEWTRFGEVDLETRYIGSGSLHCLEQPHEVMVELSSDPMGYIAFSASTGEVVGQSPPEMTGYGFLVDGPVRGVAVALLDAGSALEAWRYSGAGRWVKGETYATPIGTQRQMLVIDDGLYDVGPMTVEAGPKVPAPIPVLP